MRYVKLFKRYLIIVESMTFLLPGFRLYAVCRKFVAPFLKVHHKCYVYHHFDYTRGLTIPFSQNVNFLKNWGLLMRYIYRSTIGKRKYLLVGHLKKKNQKSDIIKIVSLLKLCRGCKIVIITPLDLILFAYMLT
jgi:hypothetical protein